MHPPTHNLASKSTIVISPNSSTNTFADFNHFKENASKVVLPKPSTRTFLADDARVAEEEIEMYGGDDPHEPTPRSSTSTTYSIDHIPPPPPTGKDPNQVTWDGPDDKSNPQNWTTAYKWAITTLCIALTVNVTFASSAPSATSRSLVQEFHITNEVSYLVTTVFLIGYVFGPLFWGPGSELVGRRPVFILTMSSYTLFHLGQSLAPNIQTLLVTRFFCGFFASAPVTNCGGLIADIWSAEIRGLATSLFTAGVFLGPVLGPLISGFILQSHLTWRWVYWVMMIFAGACTIVMIPCLPETFAPVLLQRKAKKLRKADPVKNKDLYAEHEKLDWTTKGVLHRTLLRPFQMLFLEPILLLITLYLSIVYGLLYALFQAFPIIFITRRNFTISQDGLIFIGVGIGAVLGAITNSAFSRHYPELIKRWRGFPPPEQRLYGAMLGGPLLVVSIFWLGWTGEYASVPWYVPGLSTIFLGMAIALIFMSFLTYTVDTYLMYSASAFAANTMVRSAAAAAFPLFTVQLFTNLHVNWASTLIGLIGLLFAPCPFLFYIYGPRIRENSRFAPCIDLKIAKELKAAEAEKLGQSQSTQQM
ncbi:hypothetical protein AMATHDRAFT_71263 [Amanita thiersii Skay4041]|uniref:Major facilitator superfamily (MFS) profile domain-containing protein n=1 Tax=Amanita thiersii Skay4041 TaxID=703135 RepID=A0A2A9N8Y7_9AGAR|nr:hypothetical protein AMATHDRAFT_71263 [Amanita thiersii Skay4041]